MSAMVESFVTLCKQQPLAAVGCAMAIVLLTILLRSVLAARRMDACLARIPQPCQPAPILGHALKLAGAEPWSIMAKWCEEAGNMITFNVAGQRVVYVNEPKLIKRILLTNQRNYCKDVATSYKHFMCLLGSGLVTSEGEKWKKGRLLLSHALRIDILDDVPAITHRAVSKIIEKIKTQASVDLNEEFRHMTLQVIGEAALSFTPEETDAIFPSLYLPIVHECNRRVWEPWRQYLPFLNGSRERSACLKRLNDVLCKTIQKRWAQRENEARQGVARKQDIMDLCMSQIPALDDAITCQLRDDVKTMLLAGHETSAALLTWATYELLANPLVMEEVVRESLEVYGKHIEQGTIPQLDEVKRLKWTPAVLRETLRKHSVVPLTMRVAMEDDIIPTSESGLGHEVVIPKDCTVAVGILGVHHRPDLWPNPSKFAPERFMDENAERVDPYAFIPFINGPRNCLGQHLSLMETQFALSWLMANMSLTFHGELDAAKVGKHHPYIVPSVPHNGLTVSGTMRHSSISQ
jgi:cytochrome P450